MGNSHNKLNTNTNARVSSKTELDPAYFSSKVSRRVLHTTSLQYILKRALDQHAYIKLHQNSIIMEPHESQWDTAYKGTVFCKEHIDNDQMKQIWEKINKKTRVHRWNGIKSFTIKMSYADKLTGPGFNVLAKGINQSFSKIRRLIISSPQSYITDHDMCSLSLLIAKEMSSLKSLEVNLNYSENSLIMMYKISRHLFGLNELSLDFSLLDCILDTTPKTIISLISRRLINLKVLDLKFGDISMRLSELKGKKYPWLSNQGLPKVASELTKHRLNLHSLKLDFGYVPVSTEIDWEETVSKFTSGFKDLKYLTLDFSGSKQVNYDTMQILACNTSTQLKKLEKFSLNFSACERVADDSVQILACEMIPQLTSLLELKLIFFNNPNITNESIEALVSIKYSQLPCLQRVTFCFCGCAIADNKGIQAIVSNLRTNLAHLKQFRLCLFYSKKIQKEYDRLKEEFRSISGFELLERHDSKPVKYTVILDFI